MRITFFYTSPVVKRWLKPLLSLASTLKWCTICHFSINHRQSHLLLSIMMKPAIALQVVLAYKICSSKGIWKGVLSSLSFFNAWRMLSAYIARTGRCTLNWRLCVEIKSWVLEHEDASVRVCFTDRLMDLLPTLARCYRVVIPHICQMQPGDESRRCKFSLNFMAALST